jgi:hypothetical protein
MRWKNIVALIAQVVCLIFFGGLTAAKAQCALPYTLTNGANADATQVMANYNALVTCLGNNGSVNSGTAGQVGYYGATGNAISGQSLSNFLDATFGSAQGSVLYRGASAWSALGPGLAGQVLSSGGSGANPIWSSTAATLGPVPFFGATSANWTRPAGSAFTWVNQSSATYTDNTGGGPLVMSKSPSSGDNLSLLCVAAPAAPFTYTAMATSPGFGSQDYGGYGLALYDSGSGKITTMGIGQSYATILHWSSTTSYASTLKDLPWAANLMWFRITNTGTTLNYYISVDDIAWMQFGSESVTAFMPAITNVCWGVNTNDNQSSNLQLFNELWEWTSP